MKKPSDWSSGHFRDASSDWALDPLAEPRSLAGAYLQFLAAQPVWDALKERRTTHSAIATMAGESWESQRQKLSGERSARPSDLAMWALAFDKENTSGLSDETLLPPAYARAITGWVQGEGKLPSFSEVDTWALIAQGLADSAADPVLDWLQTDHLVAAEVLALLKERNFGSSEIRPLRTGMEVAAPLCLVGSFASGVVFTVVCLTGEIAQLSQTYQVSSRKIRDGLYRLAHAEVGDELVLLIRGRAHHLPVVREILFPPGLALEARQTWTLGPLAPEDSRPQKSDSGSDVWWQSHYCHLSVVEVCQSEFVVLAIRIIKSGEV